MLAGAFRKFASVTLANNDARKRTRRVDCVRNRAALLRATRANRQIAGALLPIDALDRTTRAEQPSQEFTFLP